MATNPILSHVIRKCSVDCWFRDNMLRKSVDIPRDIIVDYKFLIYAYALKIVPLNPWVSRQFPYKNGCLEGIWHTKFSGTAISW